MELKDIFFLLSIAQKAGKLVSGQDSVGRAINAKKVNLVILSKDTSKNTSKKMMNLIIREGIPVFVLGYSDELSKAIGKRQRKVIGITDKGIAKEMYRRINLLMGVGNIDENTRI